MILVLDAFFPRIISQFEIDANEFFTVGYTLDYRFSRNFQFLGASFDNFVG